MNVLLRQVEVAERNNFIFILKCLRDWLVNRLII